MVVYVFTHIDVAKSMGVGIVNYMHNYALAPRGIWLGFTTMAKIPKIKRAELRLKGRRYLVTGLIPLLHTPDLPYARFKTVERFNQPLTSRAISYSDRVPSTLPKKLPMS